MIRLVSGTDVRRSSWAYGSNPLECLSTFGLWIRLPFQYVQSPDGLLDEYMVPELRFKIGQIWDRDL